MTGKNITTLGAHGLPDRNLPAPGPAAAVAAFIRARLDSFDATAHSAMTYTTGEWDLMTKCWVDMKARDIPIDGGGTIKSDGWDSVFMTGSDRFVAEHIVEFRPPVILAVTSAMRGAVELHAGDHECVGYHADGTVFPGVYFQDFDTCPTLLHLAAPFNAHPDFKDGWRL